MRKDYDTVKTEFKNAQEPSGPSGAQDAPIKNCEHERVDEDGYCRKCGSDTRGGFCLAQDAPQPQSKEWGPVRAKSQAKEK